MRIRFARLSDESPPRSGMRCTTDAIRSSPMRSSPASNNTAACAANGLEAASPGACGKATRWSPRRRSISRAIRTASSCSTSPGRTPMRARPGLLSEMAVRGALFAGHRAAPAGARRRMRARALLGCDRSRMTRDGRPVVGAPQFPRPTPKTPRSDDDWLPRIDGQFHWRNDAAGATSTISSRR